jgi:dihydrodipicolinate synthase/N-acetylneuraminate lyase
MITRRDFSKAALGVGAALLGPKAAMSADKAGAYFASSNGANPGVKFANPAVRGFVGTSVTPFKSDETLDGEQYQKIVDFLVRKGANLLASPMHIGEALSMTVEERKLLAKLAVEAVNGRVPVFINCSLPGTRQVIDLARHAQSVGADGIVVVSSYFYRLATTPLVEHFVAVAKSIDISVIVYRNISVGDLPLEALPEIIRRCLNIVGLKDGGHEMQYFTEACRLTATLRPDFRVYDGVEDLLNTMPVGGAGFFSPISELAPVLLKSMTDAGLAGDYEKARPLQWKVTELEKILAKFGGFAGLASHKPARALMGRPCGNPRMPLPTFNKETVRLLETELDKSGVLSDEPHGWA